MNTNLHSSIPHLTNLEISNKSLTKSDLSNEKAVEFAPECNSLSMEKFIATCQMTNTANTSSNKKVHVHDHDQMYNSFAATVTPQTSNNSSTIGSHSILLLTPTPSYASMLSISSASSSPLFISPDRSNNVLIDTSVLFLNHYKKIVKLLFDSMNADTIRECLKATSYHSSYHSQQRHGHYNRCGPTASSIANKCASQTPSLTSHHHQKCVSCLSSSQMESLDVYLERLATNPRSLKSLARQNILNRVVTLKKAKKFSSHEHHYSKHANLIATPALVEQLPLPKRVKNYLLYIP